MKRTISLILTFVFIFSFSSCTQVPEKDGYDATLTLVERDDWAPNVKTAINDFLTTYGGTEDAYVVFDFDNTCSIFDMCEQFMVYQFEIMGFAFTPEELPAILKQGVDETQYTSYFDEITDAYEYLYETYGPFTAKGVDAETSAKIMAEDEWVTFASKMMELYDYIGEKESTDVSYPWITYWYTGMTQDEVYELAKLAYEKYSKVETSTKTIGDYEYTEGIQVTENIKELWKALDENGIDVWVCTASEIDVIRAAIDTFGLHEYCTGLIGMTDKIVDGKITHEYDYENGVGWIPNEDGTWTLGTTPTKAQTQAEGKVTAVTNVCVPIYNKGPIAGFGDSTGDFNFCTEFNDLKLVVIFNRATRSTTEGGGLMAEVAMYQKDTLKYDLATANENGDTLYVLQGRDENGLRTLRASNATLRFGATEEQLFKDEDNEKQLQTMIDDQMTTEDIFNTFSTWLTDYSGYHSIKY